MSSTELRNKTQNIAPSGDEWLFAQDASDPFAVKKMSVDTLGNYISNYVGFTPEVVGSSIRTYATLIPISSTFPWLCLSYPSVNLTTTNYSTEFIDALRNRKYIYDEFGTSPVSAFTGAWASNVFTLANTPENIAMITELAEDWLYHGSPISNWRILRSNNQDYNITGITVATRQITVNIDGSATSGTSIEIFTNRVYRDATKARHFSEAGLATYQAGGGKSGRLFRRDQFQGWQAGYAATNNNGMITTNAPFYPYAWDVNTVDSGSSGRTGHVRQHNAQVGALTQTNNTPMVAGIANGLYPFTDGTNGTPRTGSETIAKSGSDYRYIYVGSYTS